MCSEHVQKLVEENLRSRRKFLSGAAFCVGIAGCAKTDEAPQKVDDKTDAIHMVSSPVDMTHLLDADFPTYFGTPDFSLASTMSFEKNGLNINQWSLSEHVGTHLDAPLHFSKDGNDIAEIPVQDLLVPLVLIDIRQRTFSDRDSQVIPNDIVAWKKRYGPLPQRCCVAMQSGWSQLVKSKKFRGEDTDGLHFPGFHVEAALMLLEDTTAIGLAVDTLSLDYGKSKKFETHTLWLPSGRWGLECVKIDPLIPASGASVFVGAPKVKGGSGGPVRAIALVPKS